MSDSDGLVTVPQLLAYLREQIFAIEKQSAEIEKEHTNEILKQNAEASKSFLQESSDLPEGWK